MYRKIFGLILIMVLLTGCGTVVENPPQPPDKTDRGTDYEQEVQGVSSVQDPAEESQNDEWVMVPVGEQPEDSQNGQVSTVDVLLNQEQAVKMFLAAWEQNDLEKMNMLTFEPLEEFFRRSNVGFASYGYLDRGDLAAFVRDGLERLRANDIVSFNDVKIKNFLPNGDKLTASLGNVLNLNFSLILDRNMWKLKSMDALAYGLEEAVPQDWGSLGKTVLVDIKDMTGNGNYKMLSMGFWNEWESVGPEPSSAVGIYEYRNGQINQLYYNDISKRFEPERVVIEGGMGRLIESPVFTWVFVEKTAEDIVRVADSLKVEYYMSLYTLEGNSLKKVEDIDWKSAVSKVLDDGAEAEWVELLGVKRFKDQAPDSLVIRAGLTHSQTKHADYQMNEGIFVMSKGDGKWDVDWYHVGTHGEYHTVIFEELTGDKGTTRLYYIEDDFDQNSGGRVFEAFYDGQKWREERIFSDKLDIKAAGDLDGDGASEFLILDNSSLKILSRDKNVLWSEKLPVTTKEVPHAWMGIVQGRQWVIAALHMGEYTDWTSQLFLWEGQNFELEHCWESEPLGSNGISAMKVRDMDKDGRCEILANFSNDYVQPGEFFKIFEP